MAEIPKVCVTALWGSLLCPLLRCYPGLWKITWNLDVTILDRARFCEIQDGGVQLNQEEEVAGTVTLLSLLKPLPFLILVVLHQILCGSNVCWRFFFLFVISALWLKVKLYLPMEAKCAPNDCWREWCRTKLCIPGSISGISSWEKWISELCSTPLKTAQSSFPSCQSKSSS